MKMMRKCSSCKVYTFKEVCPKCGKKTVDPSPPAYSPSDRYGKYRRKLLKKYIS